METTVGRRFGNEAGFTLTELMVTVVIASILLAIAVPSYTTQIRKSRRTEARSALLDLASREERYLSLNNTYTNTAGNLGYTALPQTIGSGYYQISIPNAPTAAAVGVAAFFSATATPIAGTTQAKDSQCASFSVDSTGKQSSLDSSGNDSTSTCWN
jgi:type IV pilus assembly protein PilE